jgi:peptidyl-prolyl cis-trans isomerase A (cyclophilin A)
MYKKLLICLSLLTCYAHGAAKDDGSQFQPDNYYPRVQLQTSMGNIVVELDRTRAPLASNNFLRYVKQRSYEDTIFHRVIADFVVQGGGYDVNFKELPSYPPIFNESGNGLKNEKYSISFARQNDPHSATRQFFFNLNDNESLDPGKNWGYTVFGAVVEGYEVVDAIAQVETGVDATWGWPDVPTKPVMLLKATLLPAQ